MKFAEKIGSKNNYNNNENNYNDNNNNHCCQHHLCQHIHILQPHHEAVFIADPMVHGNIKTSPIGEHTVHAGLGTYALCLLLECLRNFKTSIETP